MAQKPNHKYRVSVYLGKENYTKLEKTANDMEVTLSQLVKLLLETGMELSKAIERSLINGK